MEADRKMCLDYYEQELAWWGENVHALWGSVESQRDRFLVLSELGNFEGKSILDVGCGFGDFYGFLREKKILFKSYLGVDISDKMITIAMRKFPDACFDVEDLLIEPSAGASFDFVVASGIFPLETPYWKEITESTLHRMYDLCRIGVGVNFLSSFTTGKKFARSHYTNPGDMVDFVCQNLSPRIILRHDYRPNDFTLYIYKSSEAKRYRSL